MFQTHPIVIMSIINATQVVMDKEKELLNSSRMGSTYSHVKTFIVNLCCNFLFFSVHFMFGLVFPFIVTLVVTMTLTAIMLWLKFPVHEDIFLTVGMTLFLMMETCYLIIDCRTGLIQRLAIKVSRLSGKEFIPAERAKRGRDKP